MPRAFALFILSLVVGIGCTSGPALPSEAESRAAFALRGADLSGLEAALRREIEATGLTTPAMVCNPPDDGACLTLLGHRYTVIEEAQGRLQARVESLHPVCAEVTVVSRSTRNEDLRVGVNTCDPGRRGDTISARDGVTINGFQLGRGVYSLTSGDFHPGISIERAFTLGNADASMRLYFFTDGSLP